MTGNTQELDEIFTKYTKQVIDMCHGNRPDVADESAKAKQAILDWHNKQIEAVLDRLEIRVKVADATDRYTTALGIIETERKKLKERDDDQL